MTAGKPSFLGHLVQTMRDQTACPFEKLQVFIVEGIQFVAIGIEHAKNVAVVVAHWHNNLGTSCMECRQVADILAYVAHDDRLSRIQRSEERRVGKECRS